MGNMRRIRLLGVIAVICLTGAARAAVLGIAPVRATGEYTLVGDEIRLTETDQVVFLEIKISDWGPMGLVGWQARVDRSTYENGIGEPLSPVSAPCAHSVQCTSMPNNFGPGTHCSGGKCSWAFQDRTRGDWVFIDLESNVIVGVGGLHNPVELLYFGLRGPYENLAVTDDGTRKYGGTLLLYVPPEARGVYEISLIQEEGALIYDTAEEVNNVPTTTARIVIVCEDNGDCDDSNLCTEDVCDAGTCVHSVVAKPGTPCEGESECKESGTCDENGVCVGHVKPSGTPCGIQSTSECDESDVCDENGVCVDRVKRFGITCRAKRSTCDVREACDGVSKLCPPDQLVEAGTICGSFYPECDAPDTCDGAGTCVSNVKPQGSVCRYAFAECDLTEVCDGVSISCPPDAWKDVGTPCGSSDASECNEPDTCDENGACVDRVKPLGVVCREALGECDAAEACDGLSASCPPDLLRANGEVCPDSDDPCSDDRCFEGVCISIDDCSCEESVVCGDGCCVTPDEQCRTCAEDCRDLADIADLFTCVQPEPLPDMSPCVEFDLDGDGMITLVDYLIYVKRYFGGP